MRRTGNFIGRQENVTPVVGRPSGTVKIEEADVSYGNKL
jgi:hypothetical protein